MVEVVFDIETMNLFGDNGATLPEHLGVSVVSAYRRETDSLGNEKRGEMNVRLWRIGEKREKHSPARLNDVSPRQNDFVGLGSGRGKMPTLRPVPLGLKLS